MDCEFLQQLNGQCGLCLRFLLTFAVTTFYVSPICANVSAVDCLAPEPLVSVLKGLEEREWGAVSKRTLRSMWPPEAGDLDCNDTACQTLSNKGKVTDGECECCVLFNFDIDRDDKGAVINERLYSVVIYYSASDKNKTVEVTRTLAEAFGAPNSVTSTIRGKRQQQLYWNLDRGKNTEVALMELTVTHRRRSWTVYIHFSRHQA